MQKMWEALTKYVKRLQFHGSEDFKKITEELNSGNFIILDLYDLFSEKSWGTLIDTTEKMFSDLEHVGVNSGGDFLDLGHGMFALAPSPFKAWKQKPQPLKHQKSLSKQEEHQFQECHYCGASVKDINMDDHLSRVHNVGVNQNSIPNAGTLARFSSKHGEEIRSMFEEAEKSGELEKMKEKLTLLEEPNLFAEQACKTGRFKEIILALERLKDEVGGQETERWVRDAQLEVICQWNPDFEEELAGAFYGLACKTCTRTDKAESQCQEGYSNCMYDDAFLAFENDSVQKVATRLKDEEAKKSSLPSSHTSNPPS